MTPATTRKVIERKTQDWTHPSVLALASAARMDPFDAVTLAARDAVYKAMQEGWAGPPYDPMSLAARLKIAIEPTQEVVDARTVPSAGGRFRIEFNPNRSPARINFSIAHEIAHTLFPDCAQAIRNRSTHSRSTTDDWQLEMLCNVGAAEILMPVGSFKPTPQEPLSIDRILELQREFRVSSESVLLRIAKLTDHQCLVFAAHRDETSHGTGYHLDYTVCSRSLRADLPPHLQLPSASVVAQCTAIGFTAKAKEEWSSRFGPWRVECLGIGPYPGHVYPRVVGLVRPITHAETASAPIQYLRGDATQPRGDGPKTIVQVVNDKAITWGRGFAVAVKKRWPAAQKEFTSWVFANRAEFKLGSAHFARLEDVLQLGSLIAQHGYGPSLFPRIDYSALQSCLIKVRDHARQFNASVHMPRIGSGEARGDWNVISEIVDQTLSGAGIPVTVYDLPGDTPNLNRAGA